MSFTTQYFASRGETSVKGKREYFRKKERDELDKRWEVVVQWKRRNNHHDQGFSQMARKAHVE